MLKHTPLYNNHLALKAKMAPFAGWEMPVYYPAGIIAEHQAVRNSCGVFDIGHMGIIKFEIRNASTSPDISIVGASSASRAQSRDSKFEIVEKFLNEIATNDVRLLTDFSSQYSIVCNEKGGVVDDILIYKLPATAGKPEYFIIICNAVNTDKLLNWISKHNRGVEVKLMQDLSLLAVQGPQSGPKLKNLFSSLPEIKRNHCAYVGNILISRTGYTGGDGFELFVPKEKIGEVWEKLIGLGVAPCGLGARDTLRLEAALPLYGHEYDDATTPLEAGYGWAVKFDKPDFIGRDILLAEKETGLKKKLVGIVLKEKAVAREGFKVYGGGVVEIGKITSGTFSPTLEKSIALAYISYGYRGTTVEVEIRGKKAAGEIVPIPFFKHQ